MADRINKRMEADEKQRAKNRQKSAGFTGGYFVGSKSKVKNNVYALYQYIESMYCAIGRAERGSECEDGYFLEKLEKMCSRLGYNLVKKEG